MGTTQLLLMEIGEYVGSTNWKYKHTQTRFAYICENWWPNRIGRLTALPPRTPHIVVTADWVRGLDVTDIRVGGYQTVLVDPCQKNQKTYQRAQVGEGCRSSSSLHLKGTQRKWEVIASASGSSVMWDITWSSRVSVAFSLSPFGIHSIPLRVFEALGEAFELGGLVEILRALHRPVA